MIANLHAVTDRIFRGAQPQAEDLPALSRRGVRTLVNARSEARDEDIPGSGAFRCIQLPLDVYRPDPAVIVAWLRIATDPANLPLFVHCLMGRDRTGALCAAYRICVDGWPLADAIREMQRCGFGFHYAAENLRTFIESLDVPTIRRQAGLAEPGS